MRTLVVFTAISNALIATAYNAIRLGDTTCVDLDDSIHARLKDYGISSIPIRVNGDKTWEERDSEFARVAMPGSLDFNFPGLELPIWKVLSLDRFSFWNRGIQSDSEYNAIMALNWD